MQAQIRTRIICDEFIIRNLHCTSSSASFFFKVVDEIDVVYGGKLKPETPLAKKGKGVDIVLLGYERDYPM